MVNAPGAGNPFRALMLPVVSTGININNSTPPLAGRPKGGIAMRSEVGMPWKTSDCGRCVSRVFVDQPIKSRCATKGEWPYFAFAYRYGQWDTFSESIVVYPINRRTLAAAMIHL